MVRLLILILGLWSVATTAQTNCSHRLLVSGYFSTVHVYDACTGNYQQNLDTRTVLRGAQAVRQGPDGLIYVVAEQTNSIHRYRADTLAYVDRFALTPAMGPLGLAFDPAGILYVAGYDSNDVKKFDRNGNLIGNAFPARASGISGPEIGTTFGPDGNLYVPGYNSNSVIRYDPRTDTTIEVITPRQGGMVQPRGLLVAKDGVHMYLTAEGSGQLFRWNPTSGTLVELRRDLPGPAMLTYAPNGDLLVASLVGVLRLDATTGATLGTFVAAGAGGLSGPTFVALVPIPVAEFALSVTTTGTGLGVVSSSVGGISCGATCSTNIAMNTAVVLTATATAGSTFTGWTGACSGLVPTCTVQMSAAQSVGASFALLPTAPLAYSDMWWAGQAENGWGMAITQHAPSQQQFNAFYVYEANGTPTWYVMPGGRWNADFSNFSGALYRPTGARLDNFNPANVIVGNTVGNADITFTDLENATLRYTINGVAGSKNIVRQKFGVSSTVPTLHVGDLWWGGETQNGWGISLVQQFRSLFGVWYTYGTNGAATWYVMPDGAWGSGADANTYTGTLYATLGSPWLGTTYNPSALAVTQVGTITFVFTPEVGGGGTARAASAQMTYRFTAGPYAGTTQTKSITRQQF